jgi:hypothetical protein
MIKERADQCGIQIADFQLNWFYFSAFGCETHEQSHGVAVCRQCVIACLPLVHKPVGEKRLQRWGERTHETPPR